MKNTTAVLKAAEPWFVELPKHCIWAGEAGEGACATWQCTPHRADWKWPVRFDNRRQDFASLKPVSTFMWSPFGEDTEVDSLVWDIATLFHMNSSVLEDEMLSWQADIQLKLMACAGRFWNLQRKHIQTWENVVPRWLFKAHFHMKSSVDDWWSFEHLR